MDVTNPLVSASITLAKYILDSYWMGCNGIYQAINVVAVKKYVITLLFSNRWQ
jgi:hypothetical protein